jgi:hypothetical protein
VKRRIVMAILAAGAIGGYAMGFHGAFHRHHDRRAAFERHVAEVCVDAARRSDQKGARHAEE